MTNFTKTNLSDKKAFYEVFLMLAKNGKAFRDWETTKKCSIKIVLAFGDTKMAKKFKTVPLSNQTVARRVMELNDHVSSKVKLLFSSVNIFLWLWTKALMHVMLSASNFYSHYQ